MTYQIDNCPHDCLTWIGCNYCHLCLNSKEKIIQHLKNKTQPDLNILNKIINNGN